MSERYLRFDCECGAEQTFTPTGAHAVAQYPCVQCGRRISVDLRIEPPTQSNEALRAAFNDGPEAEIINDALRNMSTSTEGEAKE